MCMESVTITVDLEDLVGNPQTLYFSESSHSVLTPKFNPKPKGCGPHPTSIAQRASVHLREIYIEDRPKSYFGCLRWYPEMRLRRDNFQIFLQLHSKSCVGLGSLALKLNGATRRLR